MIDNNQLLPFICGNNEVKGRIVRLDKELNTVLKQHAYPEIVSNMLAELLIVSSLLGSQFKDDVILTVQLNSEQKLNYIIAEYSSGGKIRGYANFDPDEDYSQISYKELSRKAVMMVTIDGNNRQRYQAVIDVDGLSVSDALQKYFLQSEQIATVLKILVGKMSTLGELDRFIASGLLLQKLPGEDNQDIWQEAQTYFYTLKDYELLDINLSLTNLLFNLFNEIEVIVYEALNITHSCRCSRAKIEHLIASFSQTEIEAMKIDGKITVVCQFCNKSVTLD